MPGTPSTLISPLPLAPGRDVPVAARAAVVRLENAFIGTVATCKTNEERLAYWRVVSDFVAANLANIEGKLANTFETQGGTPASAGG